MNSVHLCALTTHIFSTVYDFPVKIAVVVGITTARHAPLRHSRRTNYMYKRQYTMQVCAAFTQM